MLWDTLERVNRLRQQAMNNPEFIDSAQKHQQAIADSEHKEAARQLKITRRVNVKQGVKTLAEIYQPSVEESQDPKREH